MAHHDYHYRTIEKVIASYDDQETAEKVVNLLQIGGAKAHWEPDPNGTDEHGSIKYSFLIVVKVTVVTPTETLVW